MLAESARFFNKLQRRSKFDSLFWEKTVIKKQSNKKTLFDLQIIDEFLRENLNLGKKP